MDEREGWRPKIFYSDPGPEQGLPEPFPAPTHLRRKERSSFNRGALYVPGVNRGGILPQGQGPQHQPRRQHPQEEQRVYGDRNVDRQGQDEEQTEGSGLRFGGGTPNRRSNGKMCGGATLHGF